MDIRIEHRPAHSVAAVRLNPGEHIRAEAGAMISKTPNITVRTDGPLSGKQGGLLKTLKRAVLSGETFFTNVYTAQHEPGEVALAPSLCGDMIVHPVTPGQDLFIQASSFVACPDSVRLDTKWQGLMRGLVSGESFFFLHASGNGPVVVNAFGGIHTVDLNGQEWTVDTGHLVAFTSGIQYEWTKASSGWISSFLSGEGFVLRVRGTGRLYLQTRNPNEFGTQVGRLLPPRSN